MRAFPLFILFVLALPGEAAAQPFSAPIVQTYFWAPRVQALGEATIGLQGYAGAAHLNPAGIGRADVVQASTAFHPGDTVFLKTPWLPAFFSERDGIYVVAPSIDVKLGEWAFGYMYREMSFGQHEERDAQNNPVGSYRSFDSVHKLSAAYDLSDRLSVGLSLNYVASRLAGASVGLQRQREASATSVDLGVLYRHVLETQHVRIEPAVGWSLTDFGTKLDFPDSPTPLPMTMRAGGALTLASKRQFLSRPIATVSLLGALSQEIEQMQLVEEDSGFRPELKSALVSLFIGWRPIKIRTNPTSEEIPEIESISVWEQTRRHAGIELALLDVLYLRWGSQYEHERLGTRDFSSFGWGVDLYYVAFERASVTGDAGPFTDFAVSTLTVRVPLRHKPENFWPEVIGCVSNWLGG